MLKAGCCESGVKKYFDDMGRKQWDGVKLLDCAIEQEDFSSARYGVSCLMTKPQRVEWAIFCAKEVLHIFEEKHPDDKRPRKAIEAAEAYLKSPTEENKRNAADAAAAAAAAADAAAYAAAADAARSQLYIKMLLKGRDILLGKG